MNSQQIQAKLESMKGNAYNYAQTIHIVQSYVVDNINEKFTIKTDKNSFTRKYASAKDFFAYWFETEENKIIDKAKNNMKNSDSENEVLLPAVYEKESGLADELVTILKDNISKVKANAGYIKQAQVINSNVNSIINIQKVKLDMLRTLRKGK